MPGFLREVTCFVSAFSAPGASARSTERTSRRHPTRHWSRSRTSTKAAAARLAKATGAEVRDAKAILAAGDIEAILIGTPTDTHADLIEAGAKAGKAVFCEKPVSLDSKRVERCVKVVEAAGTPLMIGFNRRFDPNLSALQGADREGRDRQRGDRHDPFARPGPAADLLHRAVGRHLSRHDDPRFRHGALPARRGADRGHRLRLVAGRSGDRQGRRCRYRRRHPARPPRASSRTSPTRAAPPTATTSASKCTARPAWRAPTTCSKSTVEIAGKAGFAKDPAQRFFLERYADAYRLELAAFIAAVSKGKAPSPSGRDGLQAQRLADAATKSRETGKPVAIKVG